MRDVVVVCRSTKRSRTKVAEVVDRYLPRIGDRTWKGRVSNACLDRMAREVRAVAKRNTAIAIHDVRARSKGGKPLVRIGAKGAFSHDGTVPVSVSARKGVGHGSTIYRSIRAVIGIAALFHDIGKASALFQGDLKAKADRNEPRAAIVRHELISAYVWDELFGDTDDRDLADRLRKTGPTDVDVAWERAAGRVHELHRKSSGRDGGAPLRLGFLEDETSLTFAVGTTVLTHHRLPRGNASLKKPLAGRHVASHLPLSRDDLVVADGTPFWRSPWWCAHMSRLADDLSPDTPVGTVDGAMRAAMMIADGVGSSMAVERPAACHDEHWANLVEGVPGDTLDDHVRKVVGRVPGSWDAVHRWRDDYPAIDPDALPGTLLDPGEGRFEWQGRAVRTVRDLCSSGSGGTFVCVLAGTGTGKTKVAPMLVRAAAASDPDPDRRGFRMTLGLGLRALARQSARAYVEDFGFPDRDVATFVGGAPVEFEDTDTVDAEGMDDPLPGWLRLERIGSGVPEEGDPREDDWIAGLSWDTDRRVPATLERFVGAPWEGPRRAELLTTPVVVGTVDHVMGPASPYRRNWIVPYVRIATSDLVLDEIDQYDPEDIAAIGRLVYQSGAAGRRVFLMSATMPRVVARALHAAYASGWSRYAELTGVVDKVHVACVSEHDGGCTTNADGKAFDDVFDECVRAVARGLAAATPVRTAEVLPEANDIGDVVRIVDGAIRDMGERHNTVVDGIEITVGVVRLARIRHVVRLAALLPKGPCGNAYRVVCCIHSQFPLVQRAWIEHRLARALRRTGRDPDAGLERLIADAGILEAARRHGRSRIEVVVVASPVIETGNDLDFDWAIVDPTSTRAVVQTAGRVRRHRPPVGGPPNVGLLHTPVTVLQGGSLSHPGVETPPPKPMTRVVRDGDLGTRRTVDLFGPVEGLTVDARWALTREGGLLPNLEKQVLAAFVDADRDEADQPLGRYLASTAARTNDRTAGVRMFRRSSPVIRYAMEGEHPTAGDWKVDHAPGTRASRYREVDPRMIVNLEDMEHMVSGTLTAAWEDSATMDLRRASQVDVWIGRSGIVPTVTVSSDLGVVRGTPEDNFGGGPQTQDAEGI